MTRAIPAALLALTVSSAAPSSAQDGSAEQGLIERHEQELNLSVGENRTLSAEGVQSYSEGVPGVAEIKLTPDSKKFVIVGQQPGSTTLLLLKDDDSQVLYTINVFPRPMRTVEAELNELLAGTTGIRVRRVGSRFFIEGGVSTEQELQRIQQIADLYPRQVESLVVVGGAAAARKLNIRVDFFFVQYDSTKNSGFGTAWPSQIGGPGIATAAAELDLISGTVTSATANIADQPLPGLDIAAANGWAKVLKHSTVITTNGAEATFSSGGEQNFPVTSGFTAQIQSIEFGTSVTVLPRFDPESQELEVKVVANVADLTAPGSEATELPGRNTSELSTLVGLKLGQSIVLSGISTRSQRKQNAGLPGLSRIPILGLLFGSETRASESVEGAILVIPSVIESVPMSANQIIDDALTAYRQYSGDLDTVQPFVEKPEFGDQAASPSPTERLPQERETNSE